SYQFLLTSSTTAYFFFNMLHQVCTSTLSPYTTLFRSSRIARQGSGSACRSIYGGFVEWQKGEREDGTDSYAVPIAPQNHWDLRIAAVVLTAKEKDVSSRVGMKRTVDTSVFYDGW